MAIVTTINLLQTLHRSVSGVTTAPPLLSYPASVNVPDLPFIITWPEQIQFNKETIGALSRSDTTYAVQCLIQPTEQGIFGEGLVTTATLLEALIEAYQNPANMLLSTGTYQAYLKLLSGVSTADAQPIEYAGVQYRGFTVRVQVTEKY